MIDEIFSKYPKPPCTYNLNLSNDNNGTLFQLLMGVLMYGAKKLYGDNISPENITEEQYKTLQSYMESMGYVIKYNYTDLKCINPNYIQPGVMLNIWFEQYIPNVDCHGKRIY